MRAIILLIGLLVAGALCQNTDYILSRGYYGIDFIYNNQSSYLDQIGYFNGSLYVSGAGYIHQIKDDPFEMSYSPWFPAGHPFLAFDTFVDADGFEWAFGPTSNRYQDTAGMGMVNPLYIAGRNPNTGAKLSKIEYLSDGYYMMVDCTWGNTTHEDLFSGYFVGWRADEVGDTLSAALVVIRTVIATENVDVNPPSTVFTFDANVDQVVLRREGYVSYTRDYKPWIFHDSVRGIAIVVDPATDAVYKIHTPADPTVNITYDSSRDYLLINSLKSTPYMSHISAASYNYATGFLWLGLSAWGTQPGAISRIDINKMTEVSVYHLSTFGESDPISITFGVDQNGPVDIYVAFGELNYIAKYDNFDFETPTYATLPIGVNSIYAISRHQDSVIFITDQQFGVVGRIPLTNFCPAKCDYYNHGYCNNGKCACTGNGIVLGANNKCVPEAARAPNNKHDDSNAGEVALGVLFALVVVIAVVGWGLYYRLKKTGYAPV